MIKKINSLTNPTVKNIVKLKKAGERRKQGLMIVEGEREIKIALKAGIKLVEAILCQDYNKNKEKLFFDKRTELSKDVFDKISQRESPDGNIAVFETPKNLLRSAKITSNSIIIVLEGIEKPGNLGAIMRTADAVGAGAVILNNSKIDIYNPNAIRASQGTIFSTPLVELSIEETLAFCKKHAITLFATSPRAQKSYLEEVYQGPVGIVMGSEDLGLSKKWLELANKVIKIDMSGLIDSLNLSVSTAVVAFEIKRQKNSQK